MNAVVRVYASGVVYVLTSVDCLLGTHLDWVLVQDVIPYTSGTTTGYGDYVYFSSSLSLTPEREPSRTSPPCSNHFPAKRSEQYL